MYVFGIGGKEDGSELERPTEALLFLNGAEPTESAGEALLAKPLATTPLGRPAVPVVMGELAAGYLLVCGRGLSPSFDLPSFALCTAALSVRLGVDWLARFWAFLCRRVLSKSQCVQFFQNILVLDGLFFT